METTLPHIYFHFMAQSSGIIFRIDKRNVLMHHFEMCFLLLCTFVTVTMQLRNVKEIGHETEGALIVNALGNNKDV